MNLLTLLLGAGLFFAPIWCWAAKPQLVGQVDLGTSFIDENDKHAQIALTPDGHLVVVQVEATGSSVAVQIVSVPATERPQRRGFIRIARLADLSLSADGRHLLLLVPPDRHLSQEMTDGYQLITVDLTDPDHPKETGRQDLHALEAALAPEARGYVTVNLPPHGMSKSGDDRRRIEAHWLDGRHRDRTLADVGSSYFRMAFSHSGDWLVRDPGGSLVLTNLAADPLLEWTQERGEEATDCASGLDDGDLVVFNRVWNRLEIHTSEPGLPRVATLPVNVAADCSSLPTGKADARYWYGLWNLIEVDLKNPRAPRIADAWPLPENVSPLAVDKTNRLFARREHDSSLLVYALTPDETALVDWRALSRARAQAETSRDAHPVGSGPGDPLTLLEWAGIGAALHAQVRDVTPRQAAAILDDYAFWLSQTARANDSVLDVAEVYLRRAIELDPARTVAYLNLADVLRLGLGRVTDWTTKAARAEEAEKLYRHYLRLGGHMTPTLSSFLRGDLGSEHPGNLCGIVADYANSGRLRELVADKAENMVVNHKAIDFYFTGHDNHNASTVEIFDHTTGGLLSNGGILPDNFDGIPDNSFLGFFVYRDQQNVLAFADDTHPIKLYTVEGSLVCTFANIVNETVDADAREPDLCHKLADGAGPPPIAFKSPSSLRPEDLPSDLGHVVIEGTAQFAPFNDGKPVNVVKLSRSLHIGTECTDTDYLIAETSGHVTQSGSDAVLLGALQSLNDAARCVIDPKFFAFHGLIYVDLKGSPWPPEDEADSYHFVRHVDNGRVVDVCGFHITTHVEGMPVAHQ